MKLIDKCLSNTPESFFDKNIKLVTEFIKAISKNPKNAYTKLDIDYSNATDEEIGSFTSFLIDEEIEFNDNQDESIITIHRNDIIHEMNRRAPFNNAKKCYVVTFKDKIGNDSILGSFKGIEECNEDKLKYILDNHKLTKGSNFEIRYIAISTFPLSLRDESTGSTISIFEVPEYNLYEVFSS